LALLRAIRSTKLEAKWLRTDDRYAYKHCGHCHEVRSGGDTDLTLGDTVLLAGRGDA
jgi:hypothetical protein